MSRSQTSDSAQTPKSNGVVLAVVVLCFTALIGLCVLLFTQAPPRDQQQITPLEEKDEGFSFTLQYHVDSGWCVLCGRYVAYATIGGREFSHREREEAYERATAPRPREFRSLWRYDNPQIKLPPGAATRLDVTPLGVGARYTFFNADTIASYMLPLPEGDIITPVLAPAQYLGISGNTMCGCPF